jgi:hypothetical protein
MRMDKAHFQPLKLVDLWVLTSCPLLVLIPDSGNHFRFIEKRVISRNYLTDEEWLAIIARESHIVT